MSSDNTAKKTQETQDDELKIAWRYQHLPSGSESVSSPLQFGHHFDLSQKLGPGAIETANTTLWSEMQTEEVEQGTEYSPHVVFFPMI